MASDRQLLEQIAAGEATALEVLHERHAAVLRRHLQRLVRDAAAADDLLQELFLRVWERGAGQFRGCGQPLSWLYRIASNLALNHLDAVRRRRQQALEPVGDTDDDEALLPGWMIDEAAVAPDAAVEALERQRLVRGVIDSLPPDKRDVIHMVYDACMEVADVAEALGVPEGTVKSRLFYARRQVAAGWGRITRDWEDDAS